MGLDRSDARILAAVVFIFVFVLFSGVSTVSVVLLAIYLNEFSVLGGSSGLSLLDLLLAVLVIFSGGAAYFLSKNTYGAVLPNADGPRCQVTRKK